MGRGVIKGMLAEELENSLQMKSAYEEALAQLPRGSLIKKKINGNHYYYVVYREKGKVKFDYKGKTVSPEDIERYAQGKKLRAKYRKSLSQVKKQIKFLRGTLRGKEPI